MDFARILVVLSLASFLGLVFGEENLDEWTIEFFEQHCYECHDPDTEKGGLDLFALTGDLSNAETTRAWVRIHDRVRKRN